MIRNENKMTASRRIIFALTDSAFCVISIVIRDAVKMLEKWMVVLNLRKSRLRFEDYRGNVRQAQEVLA